MDAKARRSLTQLSRLWLNHQKGIIKGDYLKGTTNSEEQLLKGMKGNTVLGSTEDNR